MSPNPQKNRATTVVRATIAATLVGGIAAFFLPTPPGQIIAFFSASVSVAYTVLYIGASTLLLMSLPKFRSKLRQAYTILAIGMILLSITQFLIPVATVVGLWDKGWFLGLQAALYPLSVLCVYIGVRVFGALVQVKGWGNSIILLTLLFIPVALLLLLGMHASPKVVGSAFVSGLVFQASYTMWQVRRQAGFLYASSMQWLFLGMVSLGVNLFAYVFGQSGLIPDLTLQQAIYTVPSVVSGIFLLVGAYKFYNIGQTQLRELPALAGIKGSIDIITYVAGLASAPGAIAAALQDLRVITATMTNGAHLSNEQQMELQRIYLDIEQCLSTLDPLRTYNLHQLREAISMELKRSHLTEQTFWPTLPAPQ